MATGEDRPKTGDARKRRAVKPQTIDLEAKDVTRDDGLAGTSDSGSAATSPRPEQEPVTSPAGDAAAGESASKAAGPGEADPREGADSEASPGDISAPARWPSRGSEFILPALTGAAAALAVVLLLYFTQTETPVTPPAGDQVTALVERLEAVEASVADAALTDTDAIAQRLAAVESRLAEDTAPDLAPLDARLAALEDAPPPAVDTGDLEARLQATETALAELRETVTDRPAPDGDLAGRIDTLEQELAAERGASQALRDEIGRRMEALAQETRRTDAVADRVVARAAAASVAAAGLTRAVDAGRPFAAELDALRPFVETDASLEALGAHAADGLATAQRLAGSFDASAVLSAGVPDGGEADGFVSRLASSARSLVVVRPSGPVEGTSREAIVSRLEAALARGDLTAAHEQWQSLDEPARQATADWGTALSARVSADAELAAVAASASAALRSAAEGDGG